jgi:hypothetical protein
MSAAHELAIDREISATSFIAKLGAKRRLPEIRARRD